MGKHDQLKEHPAIIELKLASIQIRASNPHLSNSQAIEQASRDRGFKTYAALRANIKEGGDGTR